jgi:hypothetical protein
MQSDFEGIPQGQLEEGIEGCLDESRANKEALKNSYENIKYCLKKV